MPNSIHFYKGIFLHVIPVCIIFPWSYIGKLISTGSHFFSYFLLANIEFVQITKHISVMFRNLSIICLRPFNGFSFRESSLLTINYIFSFFLLFKLCKSGLHIIHLNSDHLRFLRSVDIGGFL